MRGISSIRPVKPYNKKYRLMQKIRTDFQSRLGKSHKKYYGLQMMETYFQLNDLTASKGHLNSIMNYAIKRNSCIRENPSVILHFHQSMRSFIRAGYAIAIKEKKGTFNTVTEEAPPFLLGLLSGKEYQNPLLVFRKAFREYSIQEFDYFMSGMVYFSLGMYDNLPERNIINPYIHLVKMLDAAYLLVQRKKKP
ncbi:hypothetical protein EG352_12015 [Chryseobacterium indologenes]|uniref:Uncharacterized protein n=2 Tax=Chryseobacterium indologenes TaxID=253 RepID=A0AAD0YWL3_CHRID|nr:hypothetical protein EG352_12015 [Chryseobacterium indologenes]